MFWNHEYKFSIYRQQEEIFFFKCFRRIDRTPLIEVWYLDTLIDVANIIFSLSMFLISHLSKIDDFYYSIF